MNARPHQPWRRTLAVLAGFLTLAALSLATDQALYLLNVDPPLSTGRAASCTACCVYGINSADTSRLGFAPSRAHPSRRRSGNR